MNGYECFLPTLLIGRTNDLGTIPIAVKVDSDKVTEQMANDPMSAESKLEFSALLPDHLQAMGPVIGVEAIYEVVLNESVIQRIN